MLSGDGQKVYSRGAPLRSPCHLIRICGQTYNLSLKDKLTEANAMLYDGTQIRIT
jgi:hypothetical protein